MSLTHVVCSHKSSMYITPSCFSYFKRFFLPGNFKLEWSCIDNNFATRPFICNISLFVMQSSGYINSS